VHACCMHQFVAPRRSALSLFLLPPLSNFALQDHRVHLLAATRHGCARPEQKHGSAQVLCVCPLSAVASRSAARASPLLNLGHQRNATLTNGGKTALTSALLRAAKRASTRRRGPERQLRARVQCPWQCCQPGAPPFSALLKNPAFSPVLRLRLLPFFFLKCLYTSSGQIIRANYIRITQRPYDHSTRGYLDSARLLGES